eukprot:403357883
MKNYLSSMISNKLSSINSLKLTVLSALALTTQACSGSETYTYYYFNYYTQQTQSQTYNNYDTCNGSYCSRDLYCESSKCSGHICKSQLEAWAIFLLVFFSVMCFFTILRCIVVQCRKKPVSLTVIRNQDNRHMHQYDNHNPASRPNAQDNQRVLVNGIRDTASGTPLLGQAVSNQSLTNPNAFYQLGNPQNQIPYGGQAAAYPVYYAQPQGAAYPIYGMSMPYGVQDPSQQQQQQNFQVLNQQQNMAPAPNNLNQNQPAQFM